MALKELSERHRRSSSQFPEDFIFQLLPKDQGTRFFEVANCDFQLMQRKLPNAFTENGILIAKTKIIK